MAKQGRHGGFATVVVGLTVPGKQAGRQASEMQSVWGCMHSRNTAAGGRKQKPLVGGFFNRFVISG